MCGAKLDTLFLLFIVFDRCKHTSNALKTSFSLDLSVEVASGSQSVAKHTRANAAKQSTSRGINLDLNDDNANLTTAEKASGSQSVAASTAKRTRVSKSRRKSDDSSEDDEVVIKNSCCVCWRKIKPSERYKICIECKGHAHVDCVRTTDDIFICPHCFSDLDEDDPDELD